MVTLENLAILSCLRAVRVRQEGGFRPALIRFLSRACREDNVLRALLHLIPSLTPVGMIHTGLLTVEECESIISSGFPAQEEDDAHLLERVAGNADNVIALRESVLRRLEADDAAVAPIWRT